MDSNTHIDSLSRHLAVFQAKELLPVSRVSKNDRKRLQSLFDTGVIEETRSGAGRCYFVTNYSALGSFIQAHYPSGLAGFQGELPSRSKAVANFKDSKRADIENGTMLIIRGFNGCTLKNDDTELPVDKWTQIAGIAAVKLDLMDGFACQGTIALVENYETFLHIERIAPHISLAIYYGGRIGANVLAWLGTLESQIIHFPDYDPVGLDEYLRAKAACPDRTSLYIPNNIAIFFEKYGKRKLLEDSVAVLTRIRQSNDEEIQPVVELMNKYGSGLEQESLLIASPPTLLK